MPEFCIHCCVLCTGTQRPLRKPEPEIFGEAPSSVSISLKKKRKKKRRVRKKEKVQKLKYRAVLVSEQGKKDGPPGGQRVIATLPSSPWVGLWPPA